MSGNLLVRFDEGRVGRTAKCRPLSYSTAFAGDKKDVSRKGVKPQRRPQIVLSVFLSRSKNPLCAYSYSQFLSLSLGVC